MSDIFDGPPGSSPLQAEEQEGLLPTWIATRRDLNAAEQQNIARATVWVGGRRWGLSDIDALWLKDLHRRMFDDTWRWAGTFRRSGTNIGVPWPEIPTAVEGLIRDVRVQVEGGVWSADEIAVRFHHQLVLIHPFPNGNGRHARLAADVAVEALGQKRFEWGAEAELTDGGELRDAYIAALQRADRDGDIAPLLAFARVI